MLLILFDYLRLAIPLDPPWIWEIEDKHPSWTNTSREIHCQFHAKNTNECTFPRNTVVANSMLLILFQLWIPNWEMLSQYVHDAYYILSTAFYRTQLGEARDYKWGNFLTRNYSLGEWWLVINTVDQTVQATSSRPAAFVSDIPSSTSSSYPAETTTFSVYPCH
jgi:hypothetical protein